MERCNDPITNIPLDDTEATGRGGTILFMDEREYILGSADSSKPWSFMDYCPQIFKTLRDHFGVNEKEYQVFTLSPRPSLSTVSKKILITTLCVMQFSMGPERFVSNLILGNMSTLDELYNTG